jgi:hypothetical protein
VQGAGHPHLTGKLHLIELPFYLLAVWWLTRTLGIEGAAIAWVARVVVDTAILFVMAQRLLRYTAAVVWQMVLVIGLAMPIMALAALPMGVHVKFVFVLLTLAVYAAFAWRHVRHEAGGRMIISIFSRAEKAFGRAE